MFRHHSIDRICCIALAGTLALTLCFMSLSFAGVVQAEGSIGYENRLFDQSRVHTIDIVMDDWETFLETCTNEEYAACTVVVDGENYGNVAIRAKGNTSLSNVASYGNDRYSFKIEFDHYESGKTYYGLDKLSLNNLIQDKTYMKDYLAYTLMDKMGVAAPLCSYVQINVNGEPWGLYLAVEGLEDSFLKRNYGADHGELYKPDSMSFGGGRGNGKAFDMDEIRERFEQNGETQENLPSFDFSQMQPPEDFAIPQDGAQAPAMPGGGRDGMGSDDVYLKYIDDNPESYANIFDSAKTDVTEADQQRLIEALKKLSEGDTSSVNAEQVMRYLVVHHFMCNDDSYTGNLVHNYYLYEENGALEMLPWDYNLSMGAFSMGGFGSSDSAASTVNAPIDSPVSDGDVSSRPMVSWIFSDEAHIRRYHEIYQEFSDMLLASGWLDAEIERVSTLIAPYVEQETRAFFTYEQFETAVQTLRAFCDLRAQSIAGQLDGSIPSTTEAQRENPAALVDASAIDLSDMGEFHMGGGGMGGDHGSRDGGRERRQPADAAQDAPQETAAPETSASAPPQPSINMEMPSFSEIPPQGFAEATSTDGAQQTALLLGSAAVLLAGLIYAWRYRSGR